MKLVTVQLNDGNEIHGHVQSERTTPEGELKQTCVDENGFLFVVLSWEDDNDPLD